MSGQPFDNTNRGALFTNRSKRSDRQPDYVGTLDVGGSKFELAAWSQLSKKGTPYLALRVSPQRETSREIGAPLSDEERERREAKRDAKRDMAAAFDDDIPF